MLEKHSFILFRTVTEEDVKVIRRKLGEVEKDQRVLAQMARESVSILNVTRLELAKNRASINWLINNLQELREEVDIVLRL